MKQMLNKTFYFLQAQMWQPQFFLVVLQQLNALKLKDLPFIVLVLRMYNRYRKPYGDSATLN